jgi:hypothetical protein
MAKKRQIRITGMGAREARLAVCASSDGEHDGRGGEGVSMRYCLFIMATIKSHDVSDNVRCSWRGIERRRDKERHRWSHAAVSVCKFKAR